MKELTIQEKAKRYDEAIDLVNSKWHYKNQPCFIQASEIFPELKDEDKIIRKELIKFVKSHLAGFPQCEKYIAWIEKQGKHKLINKIELKFNIGDWVVVNNDHQSIYQIEKIEDGYYILRHTHGGTFRVCVLHDENLRLWTIKDAKWGDILASKDKQSILIFKHLDTGTSFSSYYNIALKIDYGWSNECFIPATKEQRNLLFTKLKRDGYQWDDNKKELIKL